MRVLALSRNNEMMFSLAKFAMLVFVAFVSSGCTLFSPCGNSVLQRTKSPDGKYQAFVFLRDCGATSDFFTQVSVLPTGNSLPNNNGNIFVSEQQSTTKSGVRVRWLSASRLKVICDANAHRFKQVNRFDAITIVYATK